MAKWHNKSGMQVVIPPAVSEIRPHTWAVACLNSPMLELLISCQWVLKLYPSAFLGSDDNDLVEERQHTFPSLALVDMNPIVLALVWRSSFSEAPKPSPCYFLLSLSPQKTSGPNRCPGCHDLVWSGFAGATEDETWGKTRPLQSMSHSGQEEPLPKSSNNSKHQKHQSDHNPSWHTPYANKKPNCHITSSFPLTESRTATEESSMSGCQTSSSSSVSGLWKCAKWVPIIVVTIVMIILK